VKITFKLFANLRDYLPAGTPMDGRIELDLPAGITPMDLIERYNLPPKLAHLVLINGHYIEPDQRAVINLQEGDVLAIWPPIAGG